MALGVVWVDVDVDVHAYAYMYVYVCVYGNHGSIQWHPGFGGGTESGVLYVNVCVKCGFGCGLGVRGRARVRVRVRLRVRVCVYGNHGSIQWHPGFW